MLGILRLLRPFTSCHNGLTNGGTLCNEPHDLCKRRCDVSLINAIAGGLFTGVAAAFVVALVGTSSRGSGWFDHLIYPVFWIFALGGTVCIAYRAIGR